MPRKAEKLAFMDRSIIINGRAVFTFTAMMSVTQVNTRNIIIFHFVN